MANKNFIPSDDESQFEVGVRAPEGSSLESTRVIMESIATRVRKLDGVAATVLTIGDDQQLTRNLGTVYVKLVPVAEREETQFDIMARVRDRGPAPVRLAQASRSSRTGLALPRRTERGDHVLGGRPRPRPPRGVRLHA